MFVFLKKCLHQNSIRHSSGNRRFFDDLKKLYRSTTSKLLMASNPENHRSCFVFDKDEGTRILIQFVYEIPGSETRKKFNMFRSVDEPLSQTIRRLIATIEQTKHKKNKSKKNQRQSTDVDNQDQILVQLFDAEKNLIDENLPNKNAWKISDKLRINEDIYQIEINAPAIVKIHFPELIMANTITTAFAEIDCGEMKHSIFDWYVTNDVKAVETSEDVEDDAIWEHVHRGHCCTFSDKHVGQFVRLLCLPRNSSQRNGMPAEHRSKSQINPEPKDLPMIARHQLTKDHFPLDSDLFRVISYNILANGYSSSTGAADILFSHCPPTFLDHKYRKPLILREIIDYHADIIFLQEVDIRFFERELTSVLNENGYFGSMKVKSESVREGEAIFYRRDRFTLIDTHDIKFCQYLRDSQRIEFLRHWFSRLPEVYENLLQRNTALQILALSFTQKPNHILLACNTHLYYKPSADILRCLQTIAGLERINEVKRFYEAQNKTVSVIWSGDFNANVTSLTYHLLVDRQMLTDRNHRSYTEEYSTLIKDFHYESPIDFDTYSNYLYTHYVPNFNGVIDHIFFDRRRFQFERSIPMPSHEEITEFQGLPSCKIPSDHLAVVLELKSI